MDARQNWQCQGRQYHGWFGSGTCADNRAQDARADAADAEQARHILAVLYGVVGTLPASQRPRWESWLQRGNATRFATLLTTWAGSAHDAGDLAARFLPDGTGDRTATALHDAATAAAGARDTAGDAAASTKLAAAVQAVGMDRWARFVGAAEGIALSSAVYDKDGGQVAANYTDPAAACRALRMPDSEFKRNLHALKEAAGLCGANNVIIHVPSGDVLFNGECIGNVHDG